MPHAQSPWMVSASRCQQVAVTGWVYIEMGWINAECLGERDEERAVPVTTEKKGIIDQFVFIRYYMVTD